MPNSPVWEAMHSLEFYLKHNGHISEDHKAVVEEFIRAGLLIAADRVDRFRQVGIVVPDYQIVEVATTQRQTATDIRNPAEKQDCNIQ